MARRGSCWVGVEQGARSEYEMRTWHWAIGTGLLILGLAPVADPKQPPIEVGGPLVKHMGFIDDDGLGSQRVGDILLLSRGPVGPLPELKAALYLDSPSRLPKRGLQIQARDE